jgi:cytochrome c-type biogenesis protein CcmI
MGPGVVTEADEEREFLRRSLDDLDRELAAGDLDPADAATLRADYERRLARLDAPVEPAPPARSRRTGRTVAVVALVAVFAVGAGVAMAQAFGSRTPGDTLTGSIRESSADRLQRAAALQDRGDVLEALKVYDRVIEDDPENAEALAERGFLLLKLAASGGPQDFVADGRSFIDRAVELEPGNARWLVYRAMGLRLVGEDEAASEAIDDALAADPPPDLRALIESIRASVEG